jgi:hypothetical protein
MLMLRPAVIGIALENLLVCKLHGIVGKCKSTLNSTFVLPLQAPCWKILLSAWLEFPEMRLSHPLEMSNNRDCFESSGEKISE